MAQTWLLGLSVTYCASLTRLGCSLSQDRELRVFGRKCFVTLTPFFCVRYLYFSFMRTLPISQDFAPHSDRCGVVGPIFAAPVVGHPALFLAGGTALRLPLERCPWWVRPPALVKWICRVPSSSNIADLPSRFDLQPLLRLGATQHRFELSRLLLQ